MVREWCEADFPTPDDPYYFGKFAEMMTPFPKYPNLT
jgi:hypothetical protein